MYWTPAKACPEYCIIHFLVVFSAVLIHTASERLSYFNGIYSHITAVREEEHDRREVILPLYAALMRPVWE